MSNPNIKQLIKTSAISYISQIGLLLSKFALPANAKLELKMHL